MFRADIKCEMALYYRIVMAESHHLFQWQACRSDNCWTLSRFWHVEARSAEGDEIKEDKHS